MHNKYTYVGLLCRNGLFNYDAYPNLVSVVFSVLISLHALSFLYYSLYFNTIKSHK